MNKKILYLLAFLIKGWEVSLLLVLPILQTQGKINLFQVGILAAIFSLFQIMVSLSAGFLAERFGSKRVMVVSVLLYGIAWLLLSVPTNIITLALMCCLGGAGSGSFMPLANSTLAKMFDKNRAKEMGDFSAFSDVGRVVLSGLATFLIGTFSTTFASVSFGFLSIISAVVLIKVTILNSYQKVYQKPPTIKILHLLKIKKFVFAVLSGVFDVFASSSLYIFVPLLLIPKGIQVSSIGFLSALFFVGYLFGRVLLGRIADKFGEVKVLVVAQLLMASLIVCLIFVDNLILVSMILFILGVFTRGTSPIIRAMVANAIDDHHKFNKAFSIHSSTLNTSQVASRSIYGFSAGIFGIASVFYLSAFVAVATLIPLYLYKKVKNHV